MSSTNRKLNYDRLLAVYEQYPVLWNAEHSDYHDAKFKDVSFKDMYRRLNDEGIIKGFNEEYLKLRIRKLEHEYHREIKKIRDGVTELPSLKWFHAASFLKKSLPRRRSELNSNMASSGPAKTQDKETLHIKMPPSRTFSSNDPYGDNTCQPSSSQEESSPSGFRIDYSLIRKDRKSLEPETFADSMSVLDRGEKSPTPEKSRKESAERTVKFVDKNAASAEDRKRYEKFLRYVADEFCQLPPRQAILLQKEIQDSITRIKLSCLGSMPE